MSDPVATRAGVFVRQRKGARERAGLFDHADLGAPIFGPGLFVGSGISWHFHAEAHRLDFLPVGTAGDERLAHGLSAAFAEAAVVFGGPALVGEAGDDDLAAALLEGARDLLDFAVLGGADGLAVEVEVDRLKLLAIDVAAKKRSAFLALGQRGAGDVITGVARRLAALLICAGWKDGEEKDEARGGPSLTKREREL